MHVYEHIAFEHMAELGTENILDVTCTVGIGDFKWENITYVRNHSLTLHKLTHSVLNSQFEKK